MLLDERELYQGLAAFHWTTIHDTWDRGYYRDIIAANGGIALDISCGSGRLLLYLLKTGLNVEGLDISSDMLAMCRLDAEAEGLDPVLYEQPMQALDLPHRYQTIIIPCGSLMAVLDREAAMETLRRIHAHLKPSGMLVFNIYLPEHDYSGESEPGSFPGPWNLRAEKPLSDGRRLKIFRRVTGRDPIEQVETEERRYELYDGDNLLQEEIRAGGWRWYFRNEILWMLEVAGFAEVSVKGDYTDEDFGPQHETTMVFIAQK